MEVFEVFSCYCFQSVLPYFVATKMSKIRRASFFAPDPTTYVRSALKTLASQSRTFGCLSHALQVRKRGKDLEQSCGCVCVGGWVRGRTVSGMGGWVLVCLFYIVDHSANMIAPESKCQLTLIPNNSCCCSCYSSLFFLLCSLSHI